MFVTSGTVTVPEGFTTWSFDAVLTSLVVSSTVTATVTAVLAGTELRPSFAGLAPGFIGLYQVNLPIPPTTPPGLDLPLLLRQGGVDGNTVSVSVQ